ncbi:NADP-dependent phosphogluconate dehydrogenase [Cryobacterium sp. MDB1-18-2]|uniref:6-phosphogluconate dehydrogenase, decarboxylating n=2 Tax=Microbacteriaceae TaxID=85023 RepID=A0ABY2IJ56_9MICO|nr:MULTISPECIES: NADP-dependent phosphogluconate dehydrogenase [Cryobacterium]MDY7526951.1 NADP-dependent phosphogluconate dehydrogenase [Cryobacterium sp. 10C2]MDY7557251.1 NADP-dependent phosphogluconate dehydrogenase [Cryobacterium sp. 10C3]MEB0002249.1 NADP-dependent phosphogluconate dehydrogenase [Cryobacterium sp. RTC2.1]MEB0201173.1 NADP-dependent phosphogluconate dehydrogenase [Cryobacterium sp. 5I3]MEB0287441.1 NADP-dependent phosphogluconate dehydrogenase [Cryobacterium sp. 10S3]
MTETGTAQANIGVVGLAVMGSNLARNLASREGNTVAVYNRSYVRTQTLMTEHPEAGFVASETIEDFVASLSRPRTAIIMVQAGKGTDAVISQLAELFEPGDIIVDGGNADFHDTIRREKAISATGINFVGAGISGGEEGALKGPSIMPGGSALAYETLGPILESIAAVVDGVPCVTHIGTDGAGHFVKMVHNGIEYADMQLIAEAYDLLRHVTGHSPAAIADVFTEWNKGDLESYLIEITAEVLRQVDAETGLPFIDIVLDEAGSKGTGVWTVQNALDLGVPVAGIAEAVFARAVSSHPEQRGPVRASISARPEIAVVGHTFVDDVRQALYASKVVAYAQGFDEIIAGAAKYNWSIDKGAVATIWRGGCIIRAQFLNRIVDAYANDPSIPTLLVDPFFAAAVAAGESAWRRVVSTAALSGIPVPGFASALSYFDSLAAERLPAALVQGQRDFFGAHTYKRVDKPGVFHTLWSGDRTEIATEASTH